MGKALFILGVAALLGAAGYRISDGADVADVAVPVASDPPVMAGVVDVATPVDGGTAGEAGRAEAPGEDLRLRVERLSEDYSASFGTTCQTPQGECQVASGPIGSPCVCGSLPGKISR